MIALKYIGKGACLPPIPARDLTAEEVKQFGGEVKLLKTGLYQKPQEEKKPSDKATKIQDTGTG